MGEFEDLAILHAKVDVLTQMFNCQLNNTSNIQGFCCDFCGGNHWSVDCQIGNNFAAPCENHNYFVSNFGNDSHYSDMTSPYSNTYTPGWQNHPNLYWEGQNPQAPWEPPVENCISHLEDLIGKLTHIVEADIMHTNGRFQHQEVAIRNIEKQVGKLAQLMEERPYDSLPIESAHAITLNSGKEVQEPDSEENARIEGEEVEPQEENPSFSPAEEKKFSPNPYTPLIPYPGRLVTMKKQSEPQDLGRIDAIDRQVENTFILLPTKDPLLNTMVVQIRKSLSLGDEPNSAKYLKTQNRWPRSQEPWPPPSS